MSDSSQGPKYQIDIEHSQGNAIGDNSTVNNYYINSAELVGASLSSAASIVQNVLMSQLEQAGQLLSGEIGRQLAQKRVAYLEGRTDEALEWVRELRTDHGRWQLLNNETRAQIVRFEASLVLYEAKDIARAFALADEANTLFPSSGDIRLRAAITYAEAGPAAALPLLAEQTDRDSLNFAAALLLEQGDKQAVRDMLDCIDAQAQTDAETLRLRAIIAFLDRQFSQAQLIIQQALEQGPLRVGTRYTAAVIKYFSTLSPAIVPTAFVAWPEPVEWPFVKRDDESTVRLHEAADEFAQLVALTNDEGTRQERETWRLACLANDPDRQAEAIAYCSELLSRTPTHYRVLSWAISRNFGVNLEPSEQALRQLVEQGQTTVSHILALASFYFSQQRLDEALKLLESVRHLFVDQQAEPIWQDLYTRVVVIRGEPDGIQAVIDQVDVNEHGHYTRALAYEVHTAQTGNWQVQRDYLERTYQQTHDPQFLLSLCDLLLQHQEWEAVADQAGQLIATIGTTTAVRLAAFGLFQSHRYQECLTLLNEQRSLFPHQKLPTDLRRIRIECQRRLGIVPDAIAEAEELVREQPTVDNLIALAQLYFDKGDRLALVVIARQLHGYPELDAQHALQLAQYVHLEDRQLAIALWQQALEQGVPDRLVASAMGLGFQLGQEETLAQLMPRIQALAAEGQAGLFQFDINDFPAIAQESQERTAKLEAAYQAGQVPVHILAELRNQSLADLYHRWLPRPGSAPTPQRQPSLLIRHGGRPEPMALPSFEGPLRLHIDVTALLLAAHLNLLDVVEQTFGPVYIPQTLIPALAQMRNEMVNHQPSRFEIAQQLVALEARRMLRVVEVGRPTDEYTSLSADLGEEWVALFEAARKADGHLVDFLPLRRIPVEQEIALPADLIPYVVNCRSIVEALRKYGPLSQTEYEQVLRALGTEGAVDPSPTLPTPGSTLVFYGTVVEQLADAGVLGIVCDRFRVAVTATELNNAHSSVQYEPIRQAEIAWLTALIDRINQGIDRGMYMFIPDVDVRNSEEADRPQGFAERSLFTLLQFQTIPGDVIWVDDRCVTSYPHRVGAPIVGISEILAWLVEQNALSHDRYFALLLQLRAANVHFIPLEAKEILHHLQSARVENSAVIETQSLQILRRYLAASLLQCISIQRPPLPESAPNQWGELAFLAHLPRTIIDALTMVWDTVPDREMAQAWSEWILGNLYIDDLGTRVLASLPDLTPGSLYAMALTLASLLNRSLGRVELGTAWAREIGGYTDWIATRVINRRLTVEPNLAPAIAEIVGHIIVGLDVGELTEAQEIIKTLYFQKFYQTLPPQIREELQHNPEVLARVGHELIAVVNFNGQQFERVAFFLAASKAFNGRQETVVPLDSQFAVVFRPPEPREKDVAFVIDSPATGQVERVKNDVWQLLDESITEREAILRRYRYWFDGAASVDEVIADIASVENPEQRVDEVLGWQARSAFVYYSQLKQRLHGPGNLSRSEFLPPHPEGLLPYLRLTVEPPHGEDFTIQLAHATQRLLLDVGVHETLTRLTGLPVPIPLPLLQAIEVLPLPEQRALIKQFLRGGSPLSLIHGVHLLVRLGSAVPRFRRLARRLVKHLLSDQGRAEINAFLILLRWVNEELSFQSDIRQWPPASRLASVWTHTHVIWTLCLQVTIPSRRAAAVNQLQTVFGQPHDRIPHETFERNRMYWFDRTHPRRINSVVFLFDSLGYSLDDTAHDFIDHTMQALLQSLAFPLQGEIAIPAPSLLLHSASGYNSLDSFFGGDRGTYLAPFVGEEIAGQFHESQLDEYLTEAVSRIVQSNSDENGWLGLYIVLDDLPPPQEIAEVIDTQVRQTDFTQLVQQDIEKGMAVVRAATNQAAHLSDDARHYLLDQIVHIAAYLATLDLEEVQVREADAALPHPVGVLLQVASQASYISEDPKVVLATFSSLLNRILTAWPALLPLCRPWIQRLWEHLPSEQGQYLWPIIMTTRAAS